MPIVVIHTDVATARTGSVRESIWYHNSVALNSARSRANSWLRLLWFNCAILVTLLAGIELFGFAYYSVRGMLTADQEPTPAEFVRALPPDAYPDRSWLVDYFTEYRSPDFPIKWTSYVYWRRGPFTGRLITVNQSGLRSTWNEAASSAGGKALEVGVFGGSAVWGFGARDDFTIPSHLAKLLARKYPQRFHVTNYGETGYVSTQSLLALLGMIQPGRVPDVAIFYDGYNDAFSAYQNGQAGLPMNELNRVREFNLLSGPRAHDLYLALLSRTNTYALASGIRRRLAGAAATGPTASQPSMDLDALAQDVVDVYSRNANVVAGIAKTWNVAYRTFWQPAVFTKATRTEFEHRMFDDPDGFWPFYRLTRVKLAQSPLTAVPEFRDLSTALDGVSRTAFIDAVHTTEVANEAIANRIFADMASVFAEKAR